VLLPLLVEPFEPRPVASVDAIEQVHQMDCAEASTLA
jgi:hypothetical protein